MPVFLFPIFAFSSYNVERQKGGAVVRQYITYAQQHRLLRYFVNDTQQYGWYIYAEEEPLVIKAACRYDHFLYIVCGWTNTLYAFDLQNGRMRYRVNIVGKSPVSLAAGEQYLYICCQDTDTLHLADRSTGRPLLSVHTGCMLTDMAVNGGCCLVCAGEDRKIVLLAGEKLEELKELQLDFFPTAALWSGNDAIYICGQEDDQGGKILLADGSLRKSTEVQTAGQPAKIIEYRRNIGVFSAEMEMLSLYDKQTLSSRGGIQTPPDTADAYSGADTGDLYFIGEHCLYVWDTAAHVQKEKRPLAAECCVFI